MITLTMIICTTVLICKDKIDKAPIGGCLMLCGCIDLAMTGILVTSL